MLYSPGSMTTSASPTPMISPRSHSAELPTSKDDTSSAARTDAASTPDGNTGNDAHNQSEDTKEPSIAGDDRSPSALPAAMTVRCAPDSRSAAVAQPGQ